MCCIRRFLWILAYFLGNSLFGQDNFTGYLEPDISINYKVATNYSHNFELSQRSYIYDKKLELRTRQVDIAHFSELKIAYDQSIALGIQYRFRQVFEGVGENELRITQQYNITNNYGSFRFGNRLRAEQRITPSLTTHRFRYRLAVDVPLRGEKLDVGEAFFVASTESLLSVARGSKPEFDQRLTATVGWLLKNNVTLELGSEYR
ncbi:DUF2490 domain-containing protein, partial [Pricia sp.]|uniref:DUF2490 domain-containing protein n=1 Tax=Pricia sp. TaxID=2268138 RepID=UPI0035941339